MSKAAVLSRGFITSKSKDAYHFFQKNDKPDLMCVEVDDQIYCYTG